MHLVHLPTDYHNMMDFDHVVEYKQQPQIHIVSYGRLQRI